MIEPVNVNLVGLARDLNLPSESVSTVVALLIEENPIPFIARYRKDVTGNMNEDQIRAIDAKYREQKLLADRKVSILRSLESAGKLTPDLEKKVRSARNSRRLTDLYLPYKQPKQSLASAAREKGLQALAEQILAGTATNLSELAASFVNPENGAASVEEALQGAGHIISETYNVSPELRQKTREIYEHTGKIVSKKVEAKKESSEEAGTPAETQSAPAAEDTPAAEAASAEDTAPAAEAAPAPETPAEGAVSAAETAPVSETAADNVSKTAQKNKKKAKKNSKKKITAEQRREQEEKLYKDYFDFSANLRNCPAYRILALNRGENEKFLRVKLTVDEERVRKEGKEVLIPADHPNRDFLNACFDDTVTRLLIPSLEREIRREMTANAKKQAIQVFAKNLRNLLLQKPLFRRRVLALDPGFRYGCKLAALDEFGNFLGNDTVFITGNAERRNRALNKIADLIEKYNLTVIAIGNGTGCREAEDLIIKMISERFANADIAYIIVNEAGASVYSVSQTASQEFPNSDALVRSAISIGRRLQDPLNELVKVDPASMGVGIYQHDLKAKDLKDSLAGVVESAVSYVGVDLNCATSAILCRVAGLNQLTAKRIAEYRKEHGPFRYRRDLMNVPGFGEAAFTHSAGFLKIRDGYEPLDSTWIHPESYELAEAILEKAGFSKEDLRAAGKKAELAEKLDSLDPKSLAQEFNAGLNTVIDILDQLKRPGRDPRESLPAPIFKKGVMKLENLEKGMELMGTVLNVVDFGAFVDIGLHNPGLIHISRMGDRFVRDAHQRLAVGDIVKVWVVDVEADRERISLSMLPPGTSRQSFSQSKEKSENRPAEQRRRPRPNRSQNGEASAEKNKEERDFQNERRRPRPERSERTPREDRPSRDDRPRGPKPARYPSEEGEAGTGERRRFDRRERFSGPRQPRVMNFESKIQKTESLSNEMKEGKEPIRSFGDLARLLSEKSEGDKKE